MLFSKNMTVKPPTLDFDSDPKPRKRPAPFFRQQNIPKHQIRLKPPVGPIEPSDWIKFLWPIPEDCGAKTHGSSACPSIFSLKTVESPEDGLSCRLFSPTDCWNVAT